MFNKDEFIKRNSEFLYQRLNNFLEIEVNEETFLIIYKFLELQNFRNGEYEGNQYLIHKKNIQEVQIVDMVSEEFCNDFSQTRFDITVYELLDLMNEMKDAR
ncbi:hypothetical protein [Acetonema longum]|uniref:Uncharacterized protein n=1 Tax=Acetonema longum DSM 6540 TaxID=1009370 RepID=F7NP05_9FIRM|nr:hypothetical protein [Acetonema longum]EGO62226.1 hypothetical protein ALO_19232 [Acetonema longum DSM 6540]